MMRNSGFTCTGWRGRCGEQLYTPPPSTVPPTALAAGDRPARRRRREKEGAGGGRTARATRAASGQKGSVDLDEPSLGFRRWPHVLGTRRVRLVQGEGRGVST